MSDALLAPRNAGFVLGQDSLQTRVLQLEKHVQDLMAQTTALREQQVCQLFLTRRVLPSTTAI